VKFTSYFGAVALQLGLLAVVPRLGWSQNACDLNKDGTVNGTDMQAAMDMSLGLLPCTAAINGTGVCNVVVVQRVINAALGGPCVTNTAPNPHSASLNWTASTSPNVAGYNVYRGIASGGPYSKLNSSLLTAVTYTDNTVQAGQTYFYVATAMDSSNNESAYSNEARAVIPSP
jgi:hypothetical protein